MLILSHTQRYPNGYIVLAQPGREDNFDLAMRNVKAVVLNFAMSPLMSLNHNVSRITYKSPVTIIGNTTVNIPTGKLVSFACDGSSYSLK